MCFGHLAKLAVKSYMFSCEAIGKVPPKDSNLSGCRRKDRSDPCIGTESQYYWQFWTGGPHSECARK